MGVKELAEDVQRVFKFIFFELPRKSFFPLVLLVGLFIATLLYMIIWYIMLFRR